jgi:hypothetical protein
MICDCLLYNLHPSQLPEASQQSGVIASSRSSVVPDCLKRVNKAFARSLRRRSNDMTNGTKSERFMILCHHLVQILHLPQVDEANRHGARKAIEKRSMIRLAKRTSSECSTMIHDGLLEILQLPNCRKRLKASLAWSLR